MTDLDQLKKLDGYAEDEKVIERFMNIKKSNKKKLAEYIKKAEGIDIDPEWIFDINLRCTG